MYIYQLRGALQFPDAYIRENDHAATNAFSARTPHKLQPRFCLYRALSLPRRCAASLSGGIGGFQFHPLPNHHGSWLQRRRNAACRQLKSSYRQADISLLDGSETPFVTRFQLSFDTPSRQALCTKLRQCSRSHPCGSSEANCL